jgi:hypothetical protein
MRGTITGWDIDQMFQKKTLAHLARIVIAPQKDSTSKSGRANRLDSSVLGV